ncbi:hypothetical protein THAOC_09611 [Thalassiosira oceanica]|uniref:Uncharacterized protein n=1 Tax=Thalassiosira oceanica TaxID=159749 RepID=K0T793_THAOC|nr:hypothetical protein THAOC_09611 [Thalassiosira oceanica]|eukprot:EJK69161.1 hypothetical protein THAOC_09611 [Thalassiosira oceanica]
MPANSEYSPSDARPISPFCRSAVASSSHGTDASDFFSAAWKFYRSKPPLNSQVSWRSPSRKSNSGLGSTSTRRRGR